MDPEGGAQSVENLRKAGNGRGKMYIIKHAGHHGMHQIHCIWCAACVDDLANVVYLDNSTAVNKVLRQELDSSAS
jgi:cardiolipin-specific phospholipase